MRNLKHKLLLACCLLLLIVVGQQAGQANAITPTTPDPGGTPACVPTKADPCVDLGDPVAKGDSCGGVDKDNKDMSVKTTINIGCEGKGNPITDALFAIIRLLSDGVGLVVIGSLVYGGIQYSASRGDPQASAQAINRIRATMIALLIYIFGYAILNYIIPIGFLHR